MTTRGPREIAAALLVAGWLLAVPPIAHASPSEAPSPTAPALTLIGSCPGARVASDYTGTLTVSNPHGAAPSVANRTVILEYWYERNTTGAGASAVFCESDSVWGATAANGSFALAPTLPNGSCTTHSCTVISGPFGPISFHLNSSDPSGNFLRVTLVGTSVHLVWAGALASVSLAPFGLITLSSFAPTTVRSIVTAGDGGPSPATVTFHWVIAGTGWRLLSGATGPNVTLEGDENGSSGTLVVFSNGSYNGSTFAPPPFTDALADVSTSIDSASLAPTAVDAGDTLSVSLTAEGAAGYRYDGQLEPGLGLVPVALTCTTSAPNLQSVVTLRCVGGYSYPSAGIAQPVANLSNGYSADVWHFPSVTVASQLRMTVAPVPAEGYRDSPVPFELSVASGTGTAPYGPACIAPGTGAIRCGAVGGSSWSLGYTYNRSGAYEAEASLVDAAGANHTEYLPVTVADPPALGPFTLATNVPAASTIVNLTTEMTGGLWPAEYWWNDSSPGGTLATGVLATDGPVRLAYRASVPGFHNLSLTVLDALGTRVATSTTLAVSEGPATQLLDDEVAARSPVPAGSAANVTLRAVSDLGGTVRTFAVGFFLSVHGPGSDFILNSSVGTLPILPNGTAFVPGSAWSEGRVTISFLATVAGDWTIVVPPVPGLRNSALNVTVPVGPESRHPRLQDPRPMAGDSRSAETLYSIVDPYGNPIHDGYVIVRSVFSATTVDVDSPIRSSAGSGTVWVNYTGLGDGAGTILVLDAYGEALLAPIHIPAVPADGIPPIPLLIGLVGVATIAGVLAVRFMIRPRTDTPKPEDPSGELERHASGRDHLLRKLSRAPAESIPGLALGWSGPGPSPDPREITEWLAALIAEGAVTAQLGPGGRPMFLRTDDGRASPELTLDDEALEQALAHRDEDADAGEPGPP